MRKIISRILRAIVRKNNKGVSNIGKVDKVKEQDLDLYWDKDFENMLDSWGEKHVWREIQLLLRNVKGPVLDIACGTGVAMRILRDSIGLDVYGFDISEMLIDKAISRGTEKNKLEVCDATCMDKYKDKQFAASYSIGSLEHFTVDGIDLFLSETSRVTDGQSYHMIPLSRSNNDEGWITPFQSYFNNSEDWWRPKFEKHFSEVQFLPSAWDDENSIGVWVCCKCSDKKEGNG